MLADPQAPLNQYATRCFLSYRLRSWLHDLRHIPLFLCFRGWAEIARIWTTEATPKRRYAAVGFRVRNVTRFGRIRMAGSQGYETHAMRICYLHSRAGRMLWESGNTMFVVCAAGGAVTSVCANGIIVFDSIAEQRDREEPKSKADLFRKQQQVRARRRTTCSTCGTCWFVCKTQYPRYRKNRKLETECQCCQIHSSRQYCLKLDVVTNYPKLKHKTRNTIVASQMHAA